jgi:alkyldihydroxyacetonephosphate synthase
MNPWIRWQKDDTRTEPAWRWLADWAGMPALLATPPRPLAEMDEPASQLSEVLRTKFAALLGSKRMKLDLAARALHGASSTADRLRVRTGDLSHLPDAVLYPASPEDVLALLRLCTEAGIVVTVFGAGNGFGAMPGRGPHAALVSLDLSAMDHLLSVDTMSGLARAEAGITADALARQLAAHGMALKGEMDGSLGGHIACNRDIAWLQAAKLATPQGLVASALSLAPASQGAFGVIISAGIRIQALPARCEYRRYLFADFASGLTALREAQRQGLARAGTVLWDAGETRFRDQMEQIGRRRSLAQRLSEIYRQVRQFDRQASALTIGFCGSEAETDAARKRFDALAKKLGALAEGICTPQKPDYRDRLLDRGLAMDMIETTASWSKLPGVYAAMRAALDRAMRAGAPRAGAHGLVLAQVCDIRHEGAKLRLTMVFPRMLGRDVAQAEAVRAAALKALADMTAAAEPLEDNLRRGIQQMLDPKAILGPHNA